VPQRRPGRISQPFEKSCFSSLVSIFCFENCFLEKH
jgi:hypothetical protein